PPFNLTFLFLSARRLAALSLGADNPNIASVFLPPLRGSDIIIAFTVGYVCAVAPAPPTAVFLPPLRGYIGFSQ
ncbi:MAG: hypothetical protein J6X49_10500, partial [Victivallales bacterium]|nr:hypothetical protein [Victivallales bacterium]